MSKKLIFGITKLAEQKDFFIGERRFKARLIGSGDEIMFADFDKRRKKLGNDQALVRNIYDMLRDFLNRRLPQGEASITTDGLMDSFSLERDFGALVDYLRTGEPRPANLHDDRVVFGRTLGDPATFEIVDRVFHSVLFVGREELAIAALSGDEAVVTAKLKTEGAPLGTEDPAEAPEGADEDDVDDETRRARATLAFVVDVLNARIADGGPPVDIAFVETYLNFSDHVPALLRFLNTGSFEEADPNAVEGAEAMVA